MMKKYDKYKDSGVGWIGEIPEHWDSIMIKRLTPVKRGASPRPIDDPKYFNEEGEYSWVRIADVSASQRYLENTTQTLSELGASLSKKRHPGDFFLSIAGTVGKPIITKIKCCIHDGFVYFPDLKINPEYLYYIFSTGLPYQGLGKWGTQLNLNTDTVGEIVIPIPKEIEEVVCYLNSKTAEIDELIADKKRLLELYKEEKTAIINQAVTGRDRVCRDRACPVSTNVKTKDSGIEWLGEIPEHWEVKRLKYVAFFQRGHDLSSSNFIDGDIPVYGSNGIIGYHNKNTGLGPSIVIGRSGSVGEVNFIKEPQFWAHNTSMFLLKDFGNNINFLFYLLKSLDLKSYAAGTAVGSLNRNNIHEIKVAFPPIEEQQSIVHYIETKCSRIDTKISRTEKLIDLLTEYRTALISEVVTGKIKVVE